MNVNVHHLQLFYLVAKWKSVSAAAREMNVTQPGVSAQLKILESEYGELFDHDTFELTERGEVMFNHGRSFFTELDAVAERVRLNLGKPLRIGGSHVVLREHMPDVAGLFFRRVPQGSLQTIAGSQQQLMDLLRERKVDLIITELNNALPRGMTGFPLIQLKVVLIVHRDFEPLGPTPAGRNGSTPPLALRKAGLNSADVPALLKAAAAQGVTAGRRITSADYFFRQKQPQELLICPAQTECVAQMFSAELERRGIAWPVRLEVSATESVTPLVLKKLGVGVTVTFPPLVNHPDLLVLETGLPPITYGVVWRGKGELEGKTMEAILATARELFPDEPHLNAKSVAQVVR